MTSYVVRNLRSAISFRSESPLLSPPILIPVLTMDTEPEEAVGIPIPSPKSFPTEGCPIFCILELRAKAPQTETKQLSKMLFEST